MSAAQAQRNRALAKANEIRTRRAKLKGALRRRELRFREIPFEAGYVQSMRVHELIGALPWYRTAHAAKRASRGIRAADLLARSRISPMARLDELPPAHLDRLVAMVEKLCPTQRPEAWK